MYFLPVCQCHVCSFYCSSILLSYNIIKTSSSQCKVLFQNFEKKIEKMTIKKQRKKTFTRMQSHIHSACVCTSSNACSNSLETSGDQ